MNKRDNSYILYKVVLFHLFLAFTFNQAKAQDTSWWQPGSVYDSWNYDQYDPPIVSTFTKEIEINNDTGAILTYHFNTIDFGSTPKPTPANAYQQNALITNKTSSLITLTYNGGTVTGNLSPYLFTWSDTYDITSSSVSTPESYKILPGSEFTLQPGESTGVFHLTFGMPWDVPNSGQGLTFEDISWSWSLSTEAATGTVTVNKTVIADPPYTGNIQFTLNCTSPEFTASGAIPVIENQGSATPISVAAGSQCTVTETLPNAQDTPDGMVWEQPEYVQPDVITAGQVAQASITNRLVKRGDGTPAPVPANGPAALVFLSILIGLAIGLRRR